MRGAGFIERMEVGIQPGRILRLGFSGLQTENRVRRTPAKNAFGRQYGTGFGARDAAISGIASSSARVTGVTGA